MTQNKLDDFTKAYIDCALWSSTDGSDEPLDANYSAADIAPETLQALVSDSASFQEANAALLEQWYAEAGETGERAGHDFWLTRNGHGAGYWDRWSGATPQGAIGSRLTDAAHAYGSCDLYVGDDGKIYA